MFLNTRTVLSTLSPLNNARRSTKIHSDVSYHLHVRRKNIERPQNLDDHLALRQWKIGFLAFYAAVALLLVGLAIGDRPGTPTIASARLGQPTGVIDAARHAQSLK
jgi:hypothetical protein